MDDEAYMKSMLFRNVDCSQHAVELQCRLD